MTSKKMVLGGILAFFMSMVLIFSVGLLTGNLFDRSGKEEQSIALTDGDWWINDGVRGTGFDGGDGSPEHPYEIQTAEQLAYLSYLVYSGTTDSQYSQYISGSYYFTGAYFKQTADIDLSAHYWQPIGTYYNRSGSTLRHYFSGIYDGNGHTVSGINTPSGTTNAFSYQGLFGYVSGESFTNEAEIKNVRVINSSIKGYQYVGGIVGCNYQNSSITNCYNTGDVTGSRSDVGGIAGATHSSSTITKSYNNGDVIGLSYVGGVVGSIGGGNSLFKTITNCYNTGSVTGSSSYVGGISGYGSTITNCYNTGTVTLNSTGTGTSYVGGIAGYGSPTNCFNLGEVTGTGSGTIKISGITANGTATNCYYGGDCTLEGYSETLATDAKNIEWYKDSSNWSNNGLWDFVCVWELDEINNNGYPFFKDFDWWLADSTNYDTIWEGAGTEEDPFLISTAQELAGLSYMVYSGKAPKTNAYYYYSGVYFKQTADINLAAHYWQPIGILYDRNGNIPRRYFSGIYNGDGFTVSGINTPSGSTGGYSAQGLFGYVYGVSSTNQAEIKNVGVINSNIQGNGSVGGIVGYAYYSTITNCYNTGNVTGSASGVGGIVGDASYYSTITNCYNTGSVTGFSSSVGGIAGDADSTITNCYNTGAVTLNSTGTGTSYVGGVVGDGNATNCFNLGEVTGTGSGTITIDGITANGTATNCYYGGDCTLSGYTEGLTENVQSQNWCEEVLKWDFVFHWKFDKTQSDYPILKTSDEINWWLAKSTYYDTTWEGKGTIEEPYLISTAQELAGLSYMVYSGRAPVTGTYYYYSGVYFKQTADINLAAHYWQPIGTYYNRSGSTLRHYFAGNYDGDGHTVSGINTVSGITNDYSYQGLFGYVRGQSSTNKAEIKNVGVINSNIQGYQHVGGIVGHGYYLTITNCYNTGSVTGSSSYVGGIVGYADSYSNITNCYNTASVTLNSTGTGTNYVGGIAGYADSYSNITNCYNTASVTLNSTGTGTNYVGGIAGYAYSSTITNCYNTGAVTGQGSYIGGLIGRSSSSNLTLKLTNCVNAGDVSGTGDSIGGIIGSIAGQIEMNNVYSFGNVSGSNYVGGLIGNSTATNISINSSLFEGNITATATTTDVYVGGFIGYGNGCSNFSVTGSYVNSKISVSVSSAYASGIVGEIVMSTTTDPLVIDKCAVVTDITSSTGEELTNSRAFYFSSNLVDTETILNSYAIFNDSLTLSDTTDGMDGNFAYLENFNGGKPVPIGIYYILDYGITTGIVDQINSLQI